MLASCSMSSRLAQGAHRQTTQASRLDGLRIHDVLAFDAKPDNVAGKSEADDLAASIGEYAVQGQGAGINAIQVRCGIAS
jgi:hypothetical protein